VLFRSISVESGDLLVVIQREAGGAVAWITE
jgi:hypothetical protein